ncbi:MAG: CHAT domain-containing protein [Nitrospirae bacterium]|nr:MAG: CHAT domain-containing protein [Nitrospirota bacterium]
MSMKRTMENLPYKFVCRFDIAFVLFMALFLSSCAGQQYLSKKQSYGEELLSEKKYDDAIAALKEAVNLAVAEKNAREIAHLKSLLGWAYAEAMRFDDAEKETKEAIMIAEANSIYQPIYYARLAVIDSKSGSYEEGLSAAEKALALTAGAWQPKAGTENREQIIDYAIRHYGFPPDVEMLKTVIMSESAASVLYMVKGDNQKSAEWGEKALRHFNDLSFIIKLAPSEEKLEFYKGMAVAAAAAGRAYRNIGNSSKEQAFMEIGKDAFKKIGIEVSGDDLLSAYAESGGYLSIARLTKGDYKSDMRYSRDFNEAERLYFYGDYEKAISTYKKAIGRAKEQGNNGEASKALSQLGWLIAELGRYPEAIRLLKESISISEREDFSAVTYSRLSAIEARIGNYEQGFIHAEKSLNAVYEKRKKFFEGKNSDSVIDSAVKDPGLPPDIVLIKSVISAESAKVTIFYLKGDYDSAIKEGERALGHLKDLTTAITLAPRREQISYFEAYGFVSLTTGDSYLNKGDIKRGRSHIEKSREFFKRAGLNYGDVIAEGLIGYSFVLEGDYMTGAGIFRKNLERIEKGGLEELKWHIRSKFANIIYAEAKLLESRVEKLSSSLEDAKGGELKKQMLEENRKKTEVLRALVDETSAEKFAQIIAQLEKTETKEAMLSNVNSLIRFLKEESYKNYHSAIENIESIRSMMETDLNKRLFQANKQSIYSGFIELSSELYGAEKGFEALERAKARGLMDLLSTKEIALKKDVSYQERKVIAEKIADELVRLKQAKSENDSDGKIAQSPLFEKETERYRGVMIRIKNEEPELSSLISADFLKYPDLKKSIAGDVTLLEYFFTAEKIFIWSIDKNRISLFTGRTKKEDLEKKVRGHRDAVIKRDRDNEKRFSKELYDVLILPVRDRIMGKRLGIVPHDILHYLPFNALNSGDKYFIEEFPLFSSPSASVLKYAIDKERPKGQKVLGFGNPDLGDPSLDLPYAQKETEMIAELYPGSKIYQGKDATERILKSEASKFDILHFATHAEFSDSDPLYSAIRLAQDNSEDGRLEAREIFSLDIKPYLVTLSACETGLGVVTGGDEIIGMNRAFIYAGAPSIVASLWSVSDISTAQLMEKFYKNLKTMTKDEAMQKAQMDLIRSKDFSEPFFWAPFYLSGAWK